MVHGRRYVVLPYTGPMLQLSRTLYKASFLLLLAGLSGAPALAQEPSDLGAEGIQLSREELEARLANYTETAESPAFSSEMRSIARREADLIRERLDRGDFKTGDQVTLVVEGEEDLTGTFSEISWEGYALAHHVSAFSLIESEAEVC